MARLQVWTYTLAAYLAIAFLSIQFGHAGQIPTAGLSTINAPQPQTQLHTGSTTDISVDISLDGQITQLPGAEIISLTIFAVSSETNANISVSDSNLIASQPPGNTVVNFNWPIPTCIQPGAYNLTFYEVSQINQQTFFIITPIPVTFLSSTATPATSCPGSTSPASQPQPDAPPAVAPSAQLTELSATSASTQVTTASTSVATLKPTTTTNPTLAISTSVITLKPTTTPNPTLAISTSLEVVTSIVSGNVLMMETLSTEMITFGVPFASPFVIANGQTIILTGIHPTTTVTTMVTLSPSLGTSPSPLSRDNGACQASSISIQVYFVLSVLLLLIT